MDSYSTALIEEIRNAFSMVRSHADWAQFVAAHELIPQNSSEPGMPTTYVGLFHGIRLTATHTPKRLDKAFLLATKGNVIALELYAPGANHPREIMVRYDE